MLNRTLTHGCTRVALGCLAAGWLLVADNVASLADDPAATEITEPNPRDAFLDRAFDLFVNQQMLEDAVVSGDASLLADVALQVAHGEDVLQRPRQGIGAADLLAAAVQAAADAGDKALLTRLQHGIQRYGQKDLEPVVTAALQLADSERKLDMPPGLESTEDAAESMALYHAMAKEIRKAQQYGSREDLQDIVASLPLVSLDKKQQDELAKLADQALAEMNDETANSALTQLASASRGFLPRMNDVRLISGPTVLKYGKSGKYTIVMSKRATADTKVRFWGTAMATPSTVTVKKGSATAVVTLKAPTKTTIKSSDLYAQLSDGFRARYGVRFIK